MSILVARYFSQYLSYVGTFLLAAILGFQVRDPDYVPFLGVMLVSWAVSPVLFRLQADPEPFLRTLPITLAELTTARFLCSLLLLGICGSLCLAVFFSVPYSPDEGLIAIKALLLGTAVALAAAGFAYVALYRHGASWVAGVAANVVVVLVALPYIVIGSNQQGVMDTRHLFPTTLVASMPTYLVVLLVLASFWAYLALLRVAIRARRTSGES